MFTIRKIRNCLKPIQGPCPWHVHPQGHNLGLALTNLVNAGLLAPSIYGANDFGTPTDLQCTNSPPRRFGTQVFPPPTPCDSHAASRALSCSEICHSAGPEISASTLLPSPSRQAASWHAAEPRCHSLLVLLASYRLEAQVVTCPLSASLYSALLEVSYTLLL